MTVIEQLNTIIYDIHDGKDVIMYEERGDLFHRAVEMGITYHLLKKSGPFLRLEQDGNEVAEAGGFAEWKAQKKKQRTEPHTSISISGNAVIGNNNSGIVQGRDFLNNASSLINTTPHPAQPNEKPTKKSDHAIWDKIKYISVIVGGLGAGIATIGKLVNWW